MKLRILILLLASVMLVSCLTGCGGKETDANKSEGQTQQAQDSQQESEVESETETEKEMSPEEKWYNSAESNGWTFSLTKKCLDEYIEYLSFDDLALDEYKIMMRERGVEVPADVNSLYFSIAGMSDQGVPFLLVSYKNDSDTNYIAFGKYYQSYEAAALSQEFDMEVRDGHESGWDSESVTTKLYVVSKMVDRYSQFYEHIQTDVVGGRYGDYSHYDDYWWQYYEQDGMWESNLEYEFRELEEFESTVRNKAVEEIKWFHDSETDKAIAYYSQFLEEDTTIYNRHDYYTDDSCILSLYKEVEDGEIYIEDEYYVLWIMEESNLYKVFRDSNGAAYSYEGAYNAVGSSIIDIFKMDDGSYRIVLKKISAVDGKGYVIKYKETDQNEAMFVYNTGNQEYGAVESFEELLKAMEEN